MSAHTPVPWACTPDPERENDSPENWRYKDESSDTWTTAIRPFGGSVEDTIAECWGTEHDDQANAARIVLAVNSHDDLLEALQAITAWAEKTVEGFDKSEWHDVYAAIAKATP